MAGNSGMGSRSRAGLLFNSLNVSSFPEPTLLLPTLADPFGHTAMLGEPNVPSQFAHPVGVGDGNRVAASPHFEHPH